MRIICNKCGRNMNSGEAISFVGCSLGKVFVPIAGAFVMKLIADYMSTQTRALSDDVLAAFANNFEIPCPGCQKTKSWDPNPEIEKPKKKPKKESVTNNL